MPLSPKDKEGLRIFGFVLFIFALIGMFAAHAKWDELQYDKNSLCRVDKEYDVTFLIVDKTDRWTESQEPIVRQRLHAIKESLLKYERFYIFTIDSDGIREDPIFSLCNPGQGRQFNPFNNNPRMRQEIWRSSFGEPLKKIIEEASTPGETNKTYLLELLSHIRQFANDKMSNRAVFISDMMQNSDSVSFYGDTPQYHSIAETLPDIDFLTSATVYFISRKGTSSGKRQAVQKFWTEYFASRNISDERFVWNLFE